MERIYSENGTLIGLLDDQAGTYTGWDEHGNVIETWDLAAQVEVETVPAVWSPEVWSDPVFDPETGEVTEPAVLVTPSILVTPAVFETRVGAALFWSSGQLTSARPLTDSEKASLVLPNVTVPTAPDPVSVLAAIKAAILANPGVATIDELAAAIADAIPEVQ